MSKKFLCLHCGEIYDELLLNTSNEDILCPKANCRNILIEVDELILPTIKILNTKGYSTEYCCSGHYCDEDPRCNIVFSEGIDIPNVPVGFKKIKRGDFTHLKSLYSSSKQSYRDFYEICDNAKRLLKWAIKLPYRK